MKEFLKGAVGLGLEAIIVGIGISIGWAVMNLLIFYLTRL